MSTILPLAYLPSVEYFTHLLRGGCGVDLGEHFVKRSERNRARILASDGVMELTVHVRNANRPRQPVRDVRLDYSKRWQHQHWGALVASYRSTPYFDFYTGRFDFVVYQREGRRLMPILAIELDSREHRADPAVQRRDRKKDQICREHGFELIRVENSYARRYNYIKSILINYFRKVS